MSKSGTNPEILVVDDDDGARTVLRDLLLSEGYVAKSARDGAEALDMVRERPAFDLVVSDVCMPHLDGFRLFSEIRALAHGAELPVILLSAFEPNDRRVHALDLGADDFVAKPVDSSELLARIRSHLRRAQRTQRLLSQAETDELTSLPNRRNMMERLRRESAQAAAEGRDLSVILIDVDGFKPINDCHGHLAGDQVLRALGAAMKAALRKQDVVGRIGGDEFLAVLPDTDGEGARHVAMRIRELVYACEDFPAPLIHKVRVSLGVASTNSQEKLVDDLLARADEHLYLDKADARRRA
jgi:diguanylate cyclase (GGDEF)-like protein